MEEAELPPEAELRGVETFDTEEVAVLVLADVETVAAELARHKGAKNHKRDILGEEIKIVDPSYLVLRFVGHPWAIVVSCTFGPNDRLSVADASALSKALATKAIFFGNSDCASYTEYELFDKGKSLERFQCRDEVNFTSQIRDVPPPEDGPDIYEFADAFFKQQDAYVPALSIELGAGEMKPGKKIDLAEQMDELSEEAFERIDYIC